MIKKMVTTLAAASFAFSMFPKTSIFEISTKIYIFSLLERDGDGWYKLI